MDVGGGKGNYTLKYVISNGGGFWNHGLGSFFWNDILVLSPLRFCKSYIIMGISDEWICRRVVPCYRFCLICHKQLNLLCAVSRHVSWWTGWSRKCLYNSWHTIFRFYKVTTYWLAINIGFCVKSPTNAIFLKK